MTFLLAILVGVLYSAGIYMILRRSLVKVIIGLIFLGYAANLLIFTIGRITKGIPAFVPADGTKLVEPFADPLPQALILTAIVIGFGVQAFAIVLFKRAYQTVGTDDLDEMKSTDELEECKSSYNFECYCFNILSGCCRYSSFGRKQFRNFISADWKLAGTLWYFTCCRSSCINYGSDHCSDRISSFYLFTRFNG
jgi:multicomponent Na+:H+ antiporter subunit C